MIESAPPAAPDSAPGVPAPFVISLVDVQPGRDAGRVGRKGSGLGHLMRLGLPVPDGFCLTTSAYQAFVESLPRELGARMAAALRARTRVSTPSRATGTQMTRCISAVCSVANT